MNPEQHAVVRHLPAAHGGNPVTTFSDLKLDPDKEQVRSVIAEGEEVQGNLVFKSGVRIAGVVRGDVTCASGTIVIEKTGHVTGNVTGSDRILIDGKVNGEGASDKVQVKSPGLIALFNHANVNADIHYGKLSTYDDMTHNGTSQKITS